MKKFEDVRYFLLNSIEHGNIPVSHLILQGKFWHRTWLTYPLSLCTQWFKCTWCVGHQVMQHYLVDSLPWKSTTIFETKFPCGWYAFPLEHRDSSTYIQQMMVGLPAKSTKKSCVDSVQVSKSSVKNLQLLQLRLWNVSIGQRSYVYLVMVTGSLAKGEAMEMVWYN